MDKIDILEISKTTKMKFYVCSKNIRESKIREMDLILCATVCHKQNVLYLYPELKGKVYTMKEYAKIDKEGQDMDVKDPWGYDEFVYRRCANEINECLQKTIEIFKNR